MPAYTSSKSAVMGMTKALANEWAKYGINVNAIAPGYMATNNTNQLRQDEECSEEILAHIGRGAPTASWSVLPAYSTEMPKIRSATICTVPP